MYYTIEGRRFLGVVCVAGVLIGTIFINISIKTGWLHTSDLLGFIDYLGALDEWQSGTFFSYVLLVRLRQLLIFFICIFLFSPYVVFCVLDFIVSVMCGTLLSAFVLKYGWLGIFRGSLFLFPHYICYGLVFALLYRYLFPRLASNYRMVGRYAGYSRGNRRWMEYKIIVALGCLLLFGLGCYLEGFVNPEIIHWLFAGEGIL